MAREQRAPGWWLLPLFLAGSGGTAIAAAVVAVTRAPARQPPAPAPVAVPLLAVPAESIAAEARVFRTTPAMMAIAATARREREAHPRDLETFRFLRAYPGAPPRIPHELTPEEFRTSACKTCHERGGYSRRFHAYVPVTPHPGNGECLQCHVGADELMAIPLLSPDSSRRCHQCHGAGGRPHAFAEDLPGWRPAPWPTMAGDTRAGTPPPPIPHDLQGRGNCVACHAGPAAVAEIRTTHPEWADCRQCHAAPDPDVGPFTRADSGAGDGAGGAP